MSTPTHAPIITAASISASVSRPEFIPLPARGGDPVCNLSRSFWLDAEARGMIRLVRLRKPGRVRGRTLLPVADAIAFVRKLGAGSSA
jgi:hypothetical protein